MALVHVWSVLYMYWESYFFPFVTKISLQCVWLRLVLQSWYSYGRVSWILFRLLHQQNWLLSCNQLDLCEATGNAQMSLTSRTFVTGDAQVWKHSAWPSESRLSTKSCPATKLCVHISGAERHQKPPLLMLPHSQAIQSVVEQVYPISCTLSDGAGQVKKGVPSWGLVQQMCSPGLSFTPFVYKLHFLCT